MSLPESWMPYCGAAPEPAGLMSRWNLDPAVILILTILLLHSSMRHVPDRRRWFLPGLAVLAVLFISPFCALTSALFSARVAHHLVLTLAAAPLLVAGGPRRAAGPRQLAVWAAVHVTVFWLWLVPGLYAEALRSDLVYWLMQATMLGSAMALWSAVLSAPAPVAVAGLVATMALMMMPGVLLTFARAPLYAPHWLTTAAWGYSPLDDQQLAGVILWVLPSAVILAAILALLGRWLAEQIQRPGMVADPG